MSCETSYGRFLAVTCAPDSLLTRTLGGGDPLVTRSVLEEVFSIAQERAAKARSERQPPERLTRPSGRQCSRSPSGARTTARRSTGL